MAGKRVGMTTDLAERKTFWQKKYGIRFYGWDVVESGLTYEQAQSLENEYRKHGFEGDAGGPKVPGPVWSVYIFYY